MLFRPAACIDIGYIAGMDVSCRCGPSFNRYVLSHWTSLYIEVSLGPFHGQVCSAPSWKTQGMDNPDPDLHYFWCNFNGPWVTEGRSFFLRCNCHDGCLFFRISGYCE